VPVASLDIGGFCRNCVRVQQASAPNYSPPREKIAVTRPGPPFERSPVQMGRAIPATDAQFAHFPGEYLKHETRRRRELDSNCQATC
jgi:hypothetical protein